MTIASLSLTFVRYDNTADMARARGAASLAPAAERMPEEAPVSAPSSCGRGCDSPRRSPLYRALMGALDSLVDRSQASNTMPSPAMSAATTPAASAVAAVDENPAGAEPVSAAVAAPATAATDVSALDLDEALMNFAHALTQMLRGAQQGDDSVEREGDGPRRRDHFHHQEHHDHRHGHGRAAWGDPAQRIAQLGAQMGASAPGPVPAPQAAANAIASAVPVATAIDTALPETPASDATANSVGAIESPSTGASLAMPAAVNLNVYVTLPWVSPANEAKQGLLDAFGTLQHSLGLPAADGPSLKAQLSAFLQALAEKLRDGDASANAMTRAGALLSVMA